MRRATRWTTSPRSSSRRKSSPTSAATVRSLAPRSSSQHSRALFAAVVAGAGPRRERQQHAGAGVARHGAALVRVEAKELALAGIEGLAPDLDAHAPADDEDQRSFLHLVLAELLACVEADEHGATHSLLGVEHDGRAGAVRGVDLVQLPVLHGVTLPGWKRGHTGVSLHSPA